MCKYINPIDTQVKFVILMHTHEFKKVKNGTGHLTHLSLKNSELYVDVSFSKHKAVNALIENKNNKCYVLYPSKDSLLIQDVKFDEQGKQNIIFLIDATWSNAKKMLRDSPNIQSLRKISFEHTTNSKFSIKKQPMDFCLSTIESTLCVLKRLNENGYENLTSLQLNGFLSPFTKMVEYQTKCIALENRSPRFKIN